MGMLKKEDFGLIYDVECDACGGNVPIFFRFMKEKGECFCRICGAANDKMIEEFEGDEGARHSEFNAKMGRIKLPQSVVRALGITFENQDVRLEGALGESLGKYVRAPQRGLVVLSGDNGVGKSVSAGWCAYTSAQGAGRFLGRGEWMRLSTFGEGAEDISNLLMYPGVVAIDEVCASGAGDPANSIRIVSSIAGQRHDEGKGTVLTTRRSKAEFDKVYGNDLLDRTRAYVDECGSGWITIRGKSRR